MELDLRNIGIGIGGLGALFILNYVIGIVAGRGLGLGIVGVIAGVVVYLVGVSNRKTWERVKQDLYPEGGDEATQQKG